MVSYKFKMSTKLKVIFGIIAVVLFFSIYLILLTKERKNKKKFYEQGFSTLVVSSNMYQGRSIEVHLQNGLKIYFMPPLGTKIMIGDSIKKERSTYVYKVYRKEHKTYKYLTTYDFENIQ
jgi:glucose uptake protein GlcU